MAVNKKYFLEFEQDIDLEEEMKKIEGELDYARGFLESVKKKLSNERFVNNAPAKVVEKEHKKLQDGQERVRILEESLKRLQAGS